MPVSCLGEPSPLAPKEATGGAVLFSVSYVTKAATSVSAAAYWRLICSGTPMGGVQWPEAAPWPPLQRQYGTEVVSADGPPAASQRKESSSAPSRRRPSPCTGAEPGIAQLEPASAGIVPFAKRLVTCACVMFVTPSPATSAHLAQPSVQLAGARYLGKSTSYWLAEASLTTARRSAVREIMACWGLIPSALAPMQSELAGTVVAARGARAPCLLGGEEGGASRGECLTWCVKSSCEKRPLSG